MGTLSELLVYALKAKSSVVDDASEPTSQSVAVAEALNFVTDYADDVEKALKCFAPDGHLLDGSELPASAFNDFYKWCMLPAMTATQKSRQGGVRCTFSANLRDVHYRKALLDSAEGRSSPDLLNLMRDELSSLARRPFDIELFEWATTAYSLPGWGAAEIEDICGTKENPRSLADRVVVDPGRRSPAQPSDPREVLVQLFVSRDEKLDEDRCFIEASGPWQRVTWLETTMMQAIYEALFRDKMRKKYQVSDAEWFPLWLADAFVRCARSKSAAVEAGMKGALFAGRRTGGLALMILQSMFLEHSFRSKDGTSQHLGVSSVTAVSWLRKAEVSPALIPALAGTHAHELSMVLSSVYGHLDDEAGVPLSQVIGHALYFYRSRPQGDVRDPARKALMPMLSDTLGTRAFLRTASMLTLPRGPHRGEPFMSVIGAARQDSGDLLLFKQLLDEFAFTGPLMASEIEVPADLFEAHRCGYALFGAGGFMGDSERAWDNEGSIMSMAIKVLRIHIDGQPSPYSPVKTGDPCKDQNHDGKFEADGLLGPEALNAVKIRTKMLSAAEPKVNAERLQEMFESALKELL